MSAASCRKQQVAAPRCTPSVRLRQNARSDVRYDHAPERKPVPVEIGLVNGRTMRGKLWLSSGRTLLEVLNGAGLFLEFTPFGEERVHSIAKAQIVTLATIDLPRPALPHERRRAIDSDDPHAILGVPPGAAWYTVRAAYLELVKSYHPDRFAGVALPDEVREYLGAKARRINAAYALLEATFKETVTGQRH